jgi:hypothetical protein
MTSYPPLLIFQICKRQGLGLHLRLPSSQSSWPWTTNPSPAGGAPSCTSAGEEEAATDPECSDGPGPLQPGPRHRLQPPQLPRGAWPVPPQPSGPGCASSLGARLRGVSLGHAQRVPSAQDRARPAAGPESGTWGAFDFRRSSAQKSGGHCLGPCLHGP